VDLYIKEIPKKRCLELVFKYHYSISMPRHTKHYLGCFSDGRLVGGLTLGWGTQPKRTIQRLFPMLDTTDYYEIGKMAMLDEMPRNSESQMLSQIIKWIKHNLTIRFLFTWADGIVGKPGYVYQSANFYYGGYIWTDVYILPTGEKLHPRSTRALLKDNARFIGKDKLFWLTFDYCKLQGIKRYKGKQFRYIYPLSHRSEKLLTQSTVPWRRSDFPKEEDLTWKIQTAKGVYTKTTQKPRFLKYAGRQGSAISNQANGLGQFQSPAPLI